MMFLIKGHLTANELPADWPSMTLAYFEVTGDDVPPVKVTRAHSGQYGDVDAIEMADAVGCPDAKKYTTVTRVG